MGYKQITETLASLELRIHNLADDNRELRTRLERAESESAALLAENQTMRQDLEAEKTAREKAVARIDALIGKIEGHAGVEKFS